MFTNERDLGQTASSVLSEKHGADSWFIFGVNKAMQGFCD